MPTWVHKGKLMTSVVAADKPGENLSYELNNDNVNTIYYIF